MVQQVRFTGLLDLDSRDEAIIPGWHKYAKNVRFIGTPGTGLTSHNIPGNAIVSNSLLPVIGTNKPNGSFYDPVRKRVYWFNYNSSGRNGIFYLDMNTRSVTRIFQCRTDSATDIMNLSLDFPVHSCAIVYRTTSDGDLLYWTDGLNRPRYINVDTVAAMAPFTEDMINAAKNAPLIPPTAEYQDDANVNVNNMRKQLFQFCYRIGYKNLEYGTISPFSKLALPDNFNNTNTQNDPTKNNYIELSFRTGGSDFQNVELFGRVNEGTNFGNWFSIVTLDRDEYGYNPDTDYTFNFYNDGTYRVAADVYINNNPKDGELYYSYLPDKANTLETLNGNVIIYGGLTDGYNFIQRSSVDVTVTSGSSAGTGIPSISFTYTATSQITVFIGPSIVNGAIYTLHFDYNSGVGGDASPANIVITTTPGDTQTSIINEFIASIFTNIPNVTATNIGSGYFTVQTTPMIGGIFGVVANVSTAGTESQTFAWDWGCNERLGIVYFDERGKTNGVVSFVGDATDTTDFAVPTPTFDVQSNVPQVPFLSASINSIPPTWAVSYQWVRAALTPKMLYWVTNDYQDPGDGFLYFGIQNIAYTKSKIEGFVPSYEFVQGDRMKVLANYNSITGFYTPYNLQLDMEVVGTINRIMNLPAENGLFIKVKKPSVLPSGPYTSFNLIKLYTPELKVSETYQIFYEWGERYAIYQSGGQRYHRGQIADQTASQPATFQWFDGDIYYRNRIFYLNVGDINSTTVPVMDANYSDIFQSQVNSNGRGWSIDPNAAQLYRQTQSRWGQSYIQDTNINRINIYYPQDFDTYDLAKGAIRRFKARDRMLRVFQEVGVGEVGVFTRYIKDSGGTTILETSDTIITKDNIQYYQGQCGLGTQPCALISARNVDYFTYPVTGEQFRLSSDGITNLSELYKGQFYLKNILVKYNKPYIQSDLSLSKIMGAFDYFDEQAIWITQAGTYSGSAALPYAFSFNEPRNGYCSFYDFASTEWIQGAEDKIITWLNGEVYINDSSLYNNFFGVQYDYDIQLPFNKDILEKKYWLSVTQVCNIVLECSDIYTNSYSYGATPQSSYLNTANFSILEGQPSSSFWRDINSRGGRLNGDFLKGGVMVINFRKREAAGLISLAEISVLTRDSALTSK